MQKEMALHSECTKTTIYKWSDLASMIVFALALLKQVSFGENSKVWSFSVKNMTGKRREEKKKYH